ncbi:hypothetical protein AK812_SmicGene16790 [Symbiodinium microadriaticum]|uniref:Uncharacterized protein n=1 Tax=Symbiodinium microadriaticum TaxID=2951 RepID=A0A1Q9DZE5_SYMMI|nr:hypothetical protein AK812_SmicGene16790 [Symbiodinium microadriaticum]
MAAAAAGVGCGCWWHQELQPSAHRHPSCSEATRRPGFISAALAATAALIEAGSAQQQSLHREILAAHERQVLLDNELPELFRISRRLFQTQQWPATDQKWWISGSAHSGQRAPGATGPLVLCNQVSPGLAGDLSLRLQLKAYWIVRLPAK